jgi:SsrA-binding protein
MPGAKKESQKVIFNRKLSHNYFIGKKFEAGLVLTGTEIKSLRLGNASIEEAFVRLDRKNCPMLMNAHIHDYCFGNIYNHDPVRSRFLLLHTNEINEIRGALERKGESVLATKIFFKSGLAKIEIAVCTAKKLFDKRRSLKEKTENRELERALRHHKT